MANLTSMLRDFWASKELQSLHDHLARLNEDKSLPKSLRNKLQEIHTSFKWPCNHGDSYRMLMELKLALVNICRESNFCNCDEKSIIASRCPLLALSVDIDC